MSPEYDVRFCASNRISRPSLALPQTSALLCFIFVVSVSYGTSACGNDYCTSLGDHISFLSILSPHKQPSTALPRFMATYARGLTSQAVNLTHTTHWSECLMYYVANACSNRNLCNWRGYCPAHQFSLGTYKPTGFCREPWIFPDAGSLPETQQRVVRRKSPRSRGLSPPFPISSPLRLNHVLQATWDT